MMTISQNLKRRSNDHEGKFEICEFQPKKVLIRFMIFDPRVTYICPLFPAITFVTYDMGTISSLVKNK